MLSSETENLSALKLTICQDPLVVKEETLADQIIWGFGESLNILFNRIELFETTT